MSELGQMEQNIVKQAIRCNQPIPERILNAPQLDNNLVFYFDAWFDLNTERPSGWSIQRIPWSAIVEYARFYDCTQQEMDKLLYLIKEIDVAHIQKWQSERANG